MLDRDHAVFAKTGKHIDDIQVGVIEGVLKRQKYSEIAASLNCTEGHVKDIGYELWQLFSEVFGEEVNKSNLRATLIRKSIIKSKVIGNLVNGVIGSVHVCASSEESPEFLRGKQQSKLEAVERMRSMGLSDEQIAEALDLSVEEI